MPKTDKNVRITVRDFVESIRMHGLSPDMKKIQIGIAVELLREQHGIKIRPTRFARLVR